MLDRERLIELIRKAKKNTKGANCDLEREMLFADYLLANGVFVPPCKAGDTVYFANEFNHCAAEIDGIHIDENGVHFGWVQYDVGPEITELWDEGEFDIDEIGKTVFLTFEEFEKALAERQGKNEKP